MRLVRQCKTSLSRQIGEGVRIRRRGGAGQILNSKAEFDRCRIPRLVIEELDEQEIDRMEEQQLKNLREELEKEMEIWTEKRSIRRDKELKRIRKKLTRIDKRVEACKRGQTSFGEGAAPKRRRKLKEPVMDERWGEQTGSSPGSIPGIPGFPIPVSQNLQEGAPPTQICPSGGNLCEGSLGGVAGEGGHPTQGPTTPVVERPAPSIEQMESSQNFTIDLLPQNKQEPPELAAKDMGRQCKVTKSDHLW